MSKAKPTTPIRVTMSSTISTIFVPDDVFLKVRDVPLDMEYVKRLRHQLQKCDLAMAASVPPTTTASTSAQGPHSSTTYSNTHHYQKQQSYRQQQQYQQYQRYPSRDTKSNTRDNTTIKKHKNECPKQSITGLLNKVSPKNIDTIASRIVDASIANGTVASANAIIIHSIKQPTYMHIFVRLLREPASRGETHRRQVLCSIDSALSKHFNIPFVHSIRVYTDKNNVDEMEKLNSNSDSNSNSNSDYGDFCDRNKAVNILTATVSFAMSCLRERLSDQRTMQEYADMLCSNYEHVQTSADLETILEITETFIKESGMHTDSLERNIVIWAKRFQDKGLVTPRARFKLLDIFESFTGFQ